MNQYNSLNVKLSNSQFNKLKSAIKNGSEVVLRLLSNMIGDSDDNSNFPHEFLLTDGQVANLHKAFENNSITNIKLSKARLFKMMQLGGFLGRLLGQLLKTGLPLIKSIIKSLAKTVLAGIHKNILGSGNNTTTLIIPNDEMKDTIETVKSLEDSGLFLKGVNEIIQNEAKEQKAGFLSVLLGTLGASLLGNILAGRSG